MMEGAKTPDELDRASDTARLVADRVVMAVRMKYPEAKECSAKIVALREIVQGVTQDVLLYGM